MMADFTVAKLGLTSEEDKANIEAVKQKLRSIDLNNKERENAANHFGTESHFRQEEASERVS